jgi:hypothetical protein
MLLFESDLADGRAEIRTAPPTACILTIIPAPMPANPVRDVVNPRNARRQPRYIEYGRHVPRSPDGVNTLTDLFSAGDANYAEFGRTTLMRLKGA